MDYTPALLYQLAKMDGAIVLASNGTKILWANVQLMPDPTILSLETGTRHRTAERVSKQTDALVIAISASRSVVSLYLDGAKYILEDIPVVLAKANQALATLDKYRSRLDQVSTRLTALEFEGGVTLHDVLTVLQRAELVTRMAVEIERYIVELGAEGRLIEMQLEETMVGVAADKSALVRDYIVGALRGGLRDGAGLAGPAAHQDLLDFGRLAELLGYDRKLNTLDHPASPRGYRILGRIPRLPKMVVQSIVSEFSTGWTRSSPPRTPSWSPWRAWATCVRRTSARAFAVCRRSTSWTVICKPEVNTAQDCAAARVGGNIISDAVLERSSCRGPRDRPRAGRLRDRRPGRVSASWGGQGPQEGDEGGARREARVPDHQDPS